MSAKKNLEISEIADAGKKSEIEISAALVWLLGVDSIFFRKKPLEGGTLVSYNVQANTQGQANAMQARPDSVYDSPVTLFTPQGL